MSINLVGGKFFAQTVRINSGLPQAAQISIFFIGKLLVLYFREGPG